MPTPSSTDAKANSGGPAGSRGATSNLPQASVDQRSAAPGQAAHTCGSSAKVGFVIAEFELPAVIVEKTPYVSMDRFHDPFRSRDNLNGSGDSSGSNGAASLAKETWLEEKPNHNNSRRVVLERSDNFSFDRG